MGKSKKKLVLPLKTRNEIRPWPRGALKFPLWSPADDSFPVHPTWYDKGNESCCFSGRLWSYICKKSEKQLFWKLKTRLWDENLCNTLLYLLQ